MSERQFKVCCILSLAEARLAIDHGASALGLVSEMPSGPGVIDEAAIREVIAGVPANIATFLLTSKTTVAEIVAQQQATGASTLQLVDAHAPELLRELRAALPGVGLFQVIHVRDDDACRQAREVAPLVDGLLLDSGDPTAAVRTLGGTGHVHDWRISRQICAEARIPVFLAGGLRPDNVAAAVAAVEPTGVDVCTGLRRDGRLDVVKLRAFVRALES